MKSHKSPTLRLFAFCLLGFLCAFSMAQSPTPESNPTVDFIEETIIAAFIEAHDGWSADEVLVNSDLNNAFIKACQRRLPDFSESKLNWTMLNLRKAKKLTAPVTKRKHAKHTEYRHAAEIAARSLEDKHQQNIDRVLCDPQLRSEFDRMAKRLAPDVSPYRLRKAALGLRKSHQLRPELVTRVAEWGRVITTAKMSEVQSADSVPPENPGVYIFYDSTGYLYIGETDNLRRRLEKHLNDSDRLSLAKYFVENGTKVGEIMIETHAFDPKSKAKLASMRRAYESELISSRKPRFNVRP